MLSFARMFMLIVSLALVLNVCEAATVQWSMYGSSGCTGSTVFAGTDRSAQTGSSGNLTLTVSSCQTNTGLTGGLSAQFYCSSAIPTSISFFTDSSCQSQTFSASAGTGGSGNGQCFAISGIANALSANVTCTNSASTTSASMFLPLMALLAVFAAFLA